MSEDRTIVLTVMLCDQGNIVTESWKKWAERGEKSWQKFGKKCVKPDEMLQKLSPNWKNNPATICRN